MLGAHLALVVLGKGTLVSSGSGDVSEQLLQTLGIYGGYAVGWLRPN